MADLEDDGILPLERGLSTRACDQSIVFIIRQGSGSIHSAHHHSYIHCSHRFLKSCELSGLAAGGMKTMRGIMSVIRMYVGNRERTQVEGLGQKNIN